MRDVLVVIAALGGFACATPAPPTWADFGVDTRVATPDSSIPTETADALLSARDIVVTPLRFEQRRRDDAFARFRLASATRRRDGGWVRFKRDAECWSIDDAGLTIDDVPVADYVDGELAERAIAHLRERLAREGSRDAGMAIYVERDGVLTASVGYDGRQPHEQGCICTAAVGLHETVAGGFVEDEAINDGGRILYGPLDE